MSKVTKRSFSYIDLIVVINIMFITTEMVLESILNLFYEGSSTLFVFARLVFMVLMLYFQQKEFGFRIKGKLLLWFLVVYTMYLFYYIFVSSIMRIDDIMAAPHVTMAFFIDTFLLFGYVICAPTILKHFNLKLFIYLSFLLCTIVSLVYVETIGIDYLLAMSKRDENIISPMGISYCNAPILALALTNLKGLHPNRFVSFSLAVGMALTVGFLLIIIGERGPMLWPLVTVAVVYYFKNKVSLWYVVLLSIVVYIIVLNFDFILENIGFVSENTVFRIEEALAGNTNGRSESDGVFVMGIKTFLKSPIWGSCFRITITGSEFYGHYPHNMFIEILMTMGVVGIVPFIIIIVKALRNAIVFFRSKQDENMTICLVFLSLVFFQLQVSATIVFNYHFWLFLYIFYCANLKYNEVFRGLVLKRNT